jgi:hypothetical protein
MSLTPAASSFSDLMQDEQHYDNCEDAQEYCPASAAASPPSVAVPFQAARLPDPIDTKGNSRSASRSRIVAKAITSSRRRSACSCDMSRVAAQNLGG